MFSAIALGSNAAYVIALLVCLAEAYACGSIPFAILIGRNLYGIDVREHGSGNTGATNVLRVLGVRAGLSVLLLDVLKGALAVVIARFILSYAAGDAASAVVEAHGILGLGWQWDLALLLTAIFAVLGHCISPWLSFKGGKGVACSLGVIAAMMPPVALGLIVVFVTVVFLSRYVSLGSVLAAASLPFLILFFYPGSPLLLGFGVALAAVVIGAHHANIGRLIKGTERKFSVGNAKRKDQKDPGDDAE
ncbi:MAG: glycerol-3-phosphate 1-O-acyltransferase PlsY [Coriobacteriales bacterium]|nr:glycerol-3-phosphate 1-O-acyltransferase PlsY [Coriobacteriales bacterium]